MMDLKYEQAVARLEEIVVLMDRGDMPLEEALALFQEGTGLVNHCSELLKSAEQTVLKLVKNSDGGVEEAPFGGDETNEPEKA